MKFNFNRRDLYGKIITLLVIIVFIAVAFYLSNNTEINKVQTRDGIYYDKAVVTKVLDENLEIHEETGFLTGTQEIEVLISSGELKGSTFELTNYANYIHNIVCEEGSKLIISISESGDLKIASVYTYDRTGPLILLMIIFCLVLCIIGGRKGVKSLLALVFTFVNIFFILVPLVYRGVSPIFAAIMIVIITTIVTLTLIDGWNAKTISAIIGTVICVIIAGGFATFAAEIAKVTDYMMHESDELMVITRQNNLDIEGILFASILISSLGAIMDTCISIASTINEVYENNPKITKSALFKSGINVGRDMIGTMSNTLILAFTGGYLATIIVLSARDITLYEIFSMPSVAIEIIQGVSGSIGIFLTVPIVALIASRLVVGKGTGK